MTSFFDTVDDVELARFYRDRAKEQLEHLERMHAQESERLNRSIEKWTNRLEELEGNQSTDEVNDDELPDHPERVSG